MAPSTASFSRFFRNALQARVYKERLKKDGVAVGKPSLAHGFSTDFMRYFVKQDPTWDHSKLNLATLPGEMKALQATISPNNPDLSGFRNRGGKLLMYHGWSDAALSPFMSINYLDKVYAHDAGTPRENTRNH